jgi:hypothetical protein
MECAKQDCFTGPRHTRHQARLRTISSRSQSSSAELAESHGGSEQRQRHERQGSRRGGRSRGPSRQGHGREGSNDSGLTCRSAAWTQRPNLPFTATIWRGRCSGRFLLGGNPGGAVPIALGPVGCGAHSKFSGSLADPSQPLSRNSRPVQQATRWHKWVTAAFHHISEAESTCKQRTIMWVNSVPALTLLTERSA